MDNLTNEMFVSEILEREVKLLEIESKNSILQGLVLTLGPSNF
jgi:hypothetical protein